MDNDNNNKEKEKEIKNKKDKFNLKVLPVTEQKADNTFDYDERLPNINNGAMVILVAPPQSGKSVLISNLLLNDNFLANRLEEVYIFSPTIFNDKTSRFLRDRYENTVYDRYDDYVIEQIIETQNSYALEDRPAIAIILDDIVGLIPKHSKINYLCSRYRHFNIKLLLFSTQLMKGIPPVVRANASNVIIFPNPNTSELGKMVDEWSGSLGGKKKFIECYQKCCDAKYQFMHIDMSKTPPVCYKNFQELVYESTFEAINSQDLK